MKEVKTTTTNRDLVSALEALVTRCLHSDGYMQKVDELFQAQQALKNSTL